MTIYEKLALIQAKLKAPKNQTNSFGGYKYRSCEDILEAVKPLLAEQKCVLLLSDGIESIGGRVYVKATATFVDTEAAERKFHTDGGRMVQVVDTEIAVSAFAREEETKKGMDASQVTGAASSYARKYALNGLFCIDDTKDSDYTNRGEKAEETPQELPDNVCRDCGKAIRANEIKYSVQKFGVPLCYACQQERKR